jgi:N-acetylneuraminic acid mutarotase
LGSTVLVFGGGSESTGLRQVQSYQGGTSTIVGSLPQARSDLAVAVAGSQAIVVGGYTGTSTPAAVLATNDGTNFQVVAQLPVPVRYPGIVAVGRTVYVIGGQVGGVATNDIQAIDLTAGTAKVVGHLPSSLTEETVFTLGGTIYLAGGKLAGVTTNTIWKFAPDTLQVTQEGTLPGPVADAPAAVIGNTAYLFGGETPSRSSTIVAVTPAR